MILLDVAARLEDIADDMVIYGQQIDGLWRPNSPVELVHVPEYAEEDPEPPAGMTYALEISLCKEVVEAYIDHSGKKEPGAMDKAEAIAYYAQYDTFLPVERV